MKNAPTFPALLERFFTERLMHQRQASPNTIASYRDTFRLLLIFAQKQLGKSPSALDLKDVDAILVTAFLDNLEVHRSISARTRNLRLTAIRAFFRFVSFEEPAHSALIQRVLAVPSKRCEQKMIDYLAKTEIEALLAAPDRATWIGRRNYAFLLLAIQTGMRLSELTGLDRSSVVFGVGSHVRCFGKGRKERCIPLTRYTSATIKNWLAEPSKQRSNALFPTIHGQRLSADTVQYLVAKYLAIARLHCPTLLQKRVTPHVLRHTAAMMLLQAGVDCSVIALWLGHESVQTTQVYLHAHMALKEAALAKLEPMNPAKEPQQYHPDDQLLRFLSSL